MLTSDNELLRLYLIEEDDNALERLIRRHSEMVLSVCLQMLWCREDAEDAFQVVFVLLCQNAKKLRRHASIRGWLHETATRTCLDVRRKRARMREVTVFTEPLQKMEPWQSISQAHGLEALHDEISRLPQKYRDVVVMFHLQGRSRTQIAELLSCSTASVKATLSRARNLLRTRLVRRGVTASTVLAYAASAPTQVQAVSAREALIRSTLDHCRGDLPTVDVGNGPAFVQSLLSKDSAMIFSQVHTLVSAAASVAFLSIVTAIATAAPQEKHLSKSKTTVIEGQTSPIDTTTSLPVRIAQVAGPAPASKSSQISSDTTTAAQNTPPIGSGSSKQVRSVQQQKSARPAPLGGVMTSVLRSNAGAITMSVANVEVTTSTETIPVTVTYFEDGQTKTRTENREREIRTSRVNSENPSKQVPLPEGSHFESLEGNTIQNAQVARQISSGPVRVVVLGKQDLVPDSWKELLRPDVLILRQAVASTRLYTHPQPIVSRSSGN